MSHRIKLFKGYFRNLNHWWIGGDYMESAQVISFNPSVLIGLQVVSMVITIALTVLMIYVCILGIKALKIYINNNSQ